MILAIVLFAIALMLDGLISNYVPFMFHNLSYFTPLLTLMTLFFAYFLLREKPKMYFLLAIIFGFLYDLSYTNLLIWNSLLFFVLALLIQQFFPKLPLQIFSVLSCLIILILLYEFFNVLLLIIFQLFPITFIDYFYKVTHSMLLNLLYGSSLYCLLYRKIHRSKSTLN